MNDKHEKNENGIESQKADQVMDPPVRGRWSSRWILLAWSTVVVSFFVALWYDIPLMQLRYEVIGEKPEGIVDQIIVGFRDFAQVVPNVVALILVATYDRQRRRRVIPIFLLSIVLMAVTSNGTKYMVGRWRPQEAIEEVAPLSELTMRDTWISWGPGNEETGTQSFPSGHSAGAFALAGILAAYYPRIRWLMWTLAVGCALSRYIDAVHWLSDCIAGSALGYLCAWVALLPERWRGR
jgi:membrane-associated phospholipid phosphatase